MWSYISDWWKTTLYHLLVRKRSIMYQSWHHCKLYCSNMHQHEIWRINLTLWWHWLCDLTEIACALSVLIDDTYISVTLVFSNLNMFYFIINISYCFTWVIVIPFQLTIFFWSSRTKSGEWAVMYMFLIGIDSTFTFIYV